MHQIKQIPEDFFVKELNNLKFDNTGKFSYYLLKKKNYNTLDAIRKACEYWNIDEKYTNFAGTKDKVAITEQYISINHGPKKDLSLKDIELNYLGTGLERLNLGALNGNYFEIVVRNIEKKPETKTRFLNLFDSQRFGKNNDNHIIGKLIIKGKFKEACELIDETKEFLTKRPTDVVGALRSLPKKTLKMYIHAYQSYLWNKAALELQDQEVTSLEVIGFGTKISNEKIKNTYEKIMKEEEITFRDFINRSIPELSEEGTTRTMFINVNDMIICELENDNLNIDKKKVLIKFSLPPGAYATNVIKELFKKTIN